MDTNEYNLERQIEEIQREINIIQSNINIFNKEQTNKKFNRAYFYFIADERVKEAIIKDKGPLSVGSLSIEMYKHWSNMTLEHKQPWIKLVPDDDEFTFTFTKP